MGFPLTNCFLTVMPSKGLLLCGRLRFPIKVYPALPDVDHSNYYQLVFEH